MPNQREVVLIFQIASMGDTVISLPCYREIARRHPDAERYLLTNYPIGAKMIPAETILSGTGLIAGSIEYPMPLRGRRYTVELYRKLRALGARTLYYLTPETKLLRLIRHYAFFRICGPTVICGMPWSRDLRYPREIERNKMWESEASRLLRCIGAQREPGAPSPVDRGLELSLSEKAAAASALQGLMSDVRFIAISVGGKLPVNDWGDSNWSRVLSKLSRAYPRLGVVFVGSADERPRNDILARYWDGPKFNSCGLLSARETAALLESACLFIGHDTGTLHLAAAVNTPVVGIYSARNVPGKWYSERTGDIFFYNQVECFGCECEQVSECPNDRKCITTIQTDQVFAGAARLLGSATSDDSDLTAATRSNFLQK